MREIIFRGKTIKQNNGVTTEKPIKENMWVYGNLTIGKIEGYKADMISNKKEIYYIDSKTIGQFTGITDKNGKKIFEGDILEDILCGDKERYTVVFDEYCRYVLTNGIKNYLLSRNNKDMEVIGNIFDNPELLEKPNEITKN